MFNSEQLIETGKKGVIQDMFKMILNVGHKTNFFLQCKPGRASSVGFCALCSSEIAGNVLTIRVSKL